MKFALPIGVDSPLGKRLVALSFFRLAVLGVFLLIIEGYYLDNLDGSSTRIAVATASLAFLSTAIYALPLRRERWLKAMAHAELVTDQLTWTAIVFISGGVTSGSTSLYGLTSLSGAILLGPPGAFSAATAGTVFYLLLCQGFANGWLKPPSDQSATAYITNGADMVYPAFSTVLATMVVALLAAYLAERLRFFGGRLEDANRRALAAERLASLGQLTAGLAHEIRNPLGSIRGSIELLRTGASLADEERDLCRLIEQETARLNQLVTDMIDLSRPREPQLLPVDLAGVIASVVELARSSSHGEGITVRYEGPPTMTVQADHSQMQQVLWNLVRNALQVSPAGSEVVVALTPPDADGGVRLSVHDQGPGVDEDVKERLFEAFFTTRTHGVGIGLAVVKQIIDAHGFLIDVASKPGDGATFAVRIPNRHVIAAALALLATGCGGRDWVHSRPPTQAVTDDVDWLDAAPSPTHPAPSATTAPTAAPTGDAAPAPMTAIAVDDRAASGDVYRNTYYFFPEEPTLPEHGETRSLFDVSCRPLRTVSQDFHDKLCVQGSGRLASGETVSFAKRGCSCAADCPRTGQRICYELLERTAFPWGRGANGRAITPLRTVAVDPAVIPLGTVLYVPEMNGMRDVDGRPHDGCFVAEDRGSKIKGKHIDFFAGTAATGDAWNRAVPSNRGVHVVVGASQCAKLAPSAAKPGGARRKKH